MRILVPALVCAAYLLPACTPEPAPAPRATSPTALPPASSPSGPVPVPASGHPRIWITAADLPRLRSWASPDNPVWKEGMVLVLRDALAIYDKEFYPGGKPNPKWPDPGTPAWVLRATEAYAELFAFFSLVDPDEAARPAHAERAKNLLMHVIREAAKGVDPDRENPAPFRARQFATYDRASGWGEGFGLTVDWIYPSLTADDKALIRRVLMRWADENVHAATSSQEHPEPIGVLADPRLLADKKRLRVTANNYFTAHMRQLVFYALPFDPPDDPPLDPAAPASRLGNTLHSYLDDAIGAWLYQQYAVYEDPTIAAPALGVPPEGLGPASGGLSPEGFLYGASIGMLQEALLALYTAGYRDPKVYGPQIRLIESGYWDRMVDGLLHSIVPEPKPVPDAAYLGPVYQFASYGDTLRFWLTPDHASRFLSLAIHDAAEGNRGRLDKDRWIAINAIQGTAPGLLQRIARTDGNSSATQSILHFLALDPKMPPPADPRPSLPRVFVDRPLGRVLARTAWGPGATVFDYKCSWETIGHQFGDCNQFEMWRKGEWLVKERSGYQNDVALLSSEYHNTLAIQNRVGNGADKPRTLQWFEAGSWERGGQFTLGENAGDPKVRIRPGAGWLYADADATSLYNRPSEPAADGATDVTHASRSIAWIEPDFIVVYDRATTRTDKRFKRFHLVTGGDPVVKGKLATFTTPGGQKLYVHTLLPASAVLTAAPADAFNRVAEGEPSRSKLKVEDPAGPRDIRFLHVLQGADAGAAPASADLVHSTAGTPFEGATVGAFAVLFPRDPAVAFTQVTYAVPKAVHAQLVSGLQPGAAYEVRFKDAGATVEVTVVPAQGGPHKADEAGVLALGGFETASPPNKIR